MKKTFPLQVPGKDGARVLEALKNEVRKYVRREQGKKPPAGFNRWEFACRVGIDAAGAPACRLSELVAAIDSAAKAGAPAVFVEILARPVLREATGEDDAHGFGQ